MAERPPRHGVSSSRAGSHFRSPSGMLWCQPVSGRARNARPVANGGKSYGPLPGGLRSTGSRSGPHACVHRPERTGRGTRGVWIRDPAACPERCSATPSPHRHVRHSGEKTFTTYRAVSPYRRRRPSIAFEGRDGASIRRQTDPATPNTAHPARAGSRPYAPGRRSAAASRNLRRGRDRLHPLEVDVIGGYDKVAEVLSPKLSVRFMMSVSQRKLPPAPGQSDAPKACP